MSTAATGALHPDLSRISQEIHENLANFETLCAGLTNAQFNWHSEPGRWSIAQNIAHLNSVNGQDLAPMSAAISTATARSQGPYHYAWIWRYFLRTMEPPVKRKFKAPKNYSPPPQADITATLAEHHHLSTTLLDLVQRANGLDLARVKTPLPALRFLKMPLGARLALISAHDRRHLAQARAARNHVEFPA